MFNKSKYVVGILAGDEAALVFSELLTHRDVARVFQRVISAGFCHYSESDGCVKVYGESISLGIKSRPEDEIHVGQAMSHPKYCV